MGLFLRSRIVTEISVIVVVLFSTFSTFFYAWTLSRSWPDADRFTKIVKVVTMVLHALATLLSILLAHSLSANARSLSFGSWSVLEVASIVGDMWLFALMCRRGGFAGVCGDDSTTCERRTLFICFFAFTFFFALVRLIVLLFVFHYSVKYLERIPSTTPSASTIHAGTQPSTSTSNSTTTPVTVAKSLAKRFHRWGAGVGRGKGKDNLPLFDVPSSSVLFDTAASTAKKHRHRPLATKEDAFDEQSSEESEFSESEEDEGQEEYERRRRERRGKVGRG